MRVDKTYCMSSFLMYRTIADRASTLAPGIESRFFVNDFERELVYDSFQLEEKLREQMEKATSGRKAALTLSGGIDSAILARFMPKGSIAYTFKCVVPGVEVTDETPAAARYAAECGLDHRIIEVYWDDFVQYAPVLMENKGMSLHSIEVQIYKAALAAKADGIDTLIFGESADVNYGGHSLLLSRDWTYGEFLDRYSYVMPYHALREFDIVTGPVAKHTHDGIVDVHEFNRDVYYHESMGSYANACETAGIHCEAPYAHTYMGVPLDYERIRGGDGKYLIREVFNRLYADFDIPVKTPMPRPMNEWMAAWGGLCAMSSGRAALRI